MSFGLFSTGVTYQFHCASDVGRFGGEDCSGEDAHGCRWTREDRSVVLAILREYERRLGLPCLDFDLYEGLTGLERMAHLFEGVKPTPLLQRYLLGCIVYQQLKDVDRLLFVYD
jgi:hypothetical protein